MPSASVAFTFERCLKRARTALLSPALTASMRVAGTAAERVTEIRSPSRTARFILIVAAPCRACIRCAHRSSNLHSSGADTKLVEIAIELIGERYEHVRNWRFFRGLNMPAA